MIRASLVLAGACALVVASPAAAAPRHDVLVLVNGRHEGSAAVAERYRSRYDLPASHILTLEVTPGDQLSRTEYAAAIERPVSQWFHREAAHDRITYIVLAPGFPTRVGGTVGRTGTVASVDSELALLYRVMVGGVAGPVGPVRNPYFTESPPEGGWPAFSRATLDTYLVGRLDGFSLDDAQALVDRCATATAGGTFVLDDRAPLDVREHRWFTTAAARLSEMLGAAQVVFDRTLSTVEGERDVMGHYSWGAADPGNRLRRLPLTFRPGAVVASLSSSDGRTFTAPPDDWRPNSWQVRGSYYRGSPEWLAGDFVRQGATGVVANVADPYGDGAVRPDVLFPAYAAGRTLGEAVWLATPSLSWQSMLVGDPLCRPFGDTAAPAPEPTFAIDERSTLTRPFYDRLVAVAEANEPAVPRAAVELGVAARALVERGRETEADRVLDTLVAAHPDYLPGLLMRAQRIDASGNRAGAIAAYRAVVAQQAGDVVALNNLAYLLVEEPSGREEALQLARQAYQASRGAAMVADTFGWVLFRSGDTAQAMRVLRDAVAAAPTSAVLQIHLARVLLAGGDLPGARTHWERALALDREASSHEHAGPLVETFAARPPGA